MPIYICKACAAHYPDSAQPPTQCIICEDERQYVPKSGQVWVTHEELNRTHTNSLTIEEPNLTSVGVTPGFGIGQRALLVQTAQGNVLWDCVPMVDQATVTAINALGGIQAIALSHPHFYSGIADWSHAFGDVPIYLHAADREWVTRGYHTIEYWEGEQLELFDGVTLIHCGGHFAGASVLHWRDGAASEGVLLTGDTVYPVGNRQHVTFLYSYPNLLPLPAHKVQQIKQRLAGVRFERIYAAWKGTMIKQNGTQIVQDSAETYIRQLA